MKFEEVLPMMKQGRTALVDGTPYRFVAGRLCVKTRKEWSKFYGNVPFFSEEWEIEKVKIKKWQWVFGRGNSALFQTSLYRSEESAEKMREQHGCDWKYPIPPTEIEVDEY